MTKNNKLSNSENIDELKVDKTKYEMVLDFASRVAESDAFDPEVMSYAELEMDNFSHICLVNFADVHFFDQGMSKQRFDKASEFVRNTSNAYAVLSGDTFTVSTLNGASNAHVNKMANTNSAILGEELLSNMKSKILFGVGGNHDGEHGARNRDTNISITRQVLKSIGVTYFQYNALLKINVYNNPFYVFVTHGCGKSSSKASSLDVMKQKCEAVTKRFGVYPNLILSGHFHADVNGRYTLEVPVYKNGVLVSTKTQDLIIESAPALQGDSEFGAANNMPTTKTNVNAFDISFKKNPYYNAQNQLTESPIIWSVNKFPILKANSDELSMPAKEYLARYHEPQDLKNQIEKFVNGKSLNLSELENNVKKIAEEVKSL